MKGARNPSPDTPKQYDDKIQRVESSQKSVLKGDDWKQKQQSIKEKANMPSIVTSQFLILTCYFHS